MIHVMLNIFFVCLFAIYTYSLMKYPLMSFAHFLVYFVTCFELFMHSRCQFFASYFFPVYNMYFYP